VGSEYIDQSRLDSVLDENVYLYDVCPTQANQPVNHQEHPIDLSTEDIFQGLDELDAEDIFSSLTDPDGSPKNNSAPGSPSHTAGGGMPMMNGTSKSKSLSDIQDEEHNLLQQPLAMGFYVSTASTGPLPKWFWGQCPEREDVCPTCFKVRLDASLRLASFRGLVHH